MGMVSALNIDDFLRDSIRKNEEEAKQILMKKRQDRIAELLAKSGLGKRFQKRTFESFKVTDENKTAYKTAFDFAKEFPNISRGLLFTGPVGVGKSHLASAIANTLIEKLYTVICKNITDIISLIKSTYGKNTELTEYEIVDILTKEVDLLIIDDLGKEKTSENTNTLLYQIVNRLYEDEKPIIITTNFVGDSLAEKLGERGEAIVSRVTEMCQPVKMTGKDWRVKGAKQNK
jgi:DNA replication protein DnaC